MGYVFAARDNLQNVMVRLAFTNFVAHSRARAALRLPPHSRPPEPPVSRPSYRVGLDNRPIAKSAALHLPEGFFAFISIPMERLSR
jgi:hypothetical protein